MNLVVTNVCNRLCEYCFQKEWFIANSDREVKEMDLASVSQILDWYSWKHFNLMGGEPLLYSKVDELLAMVREKGKTVTMISNISIDNKKFKEIISKFSGNTITSWLVNTDYPRHQEKIFIENFKILLDTKDSITLSTTLLPDKDKIKQASDRLRRLVSVVKNDSRRTEVPIRVSPAEPNYKNTYIKYDYTLDIYDIYLRLKRELPGVSVGMDCPVVACELNYETYSNRDVKISFSGVSCKGDPPFDIMPDRSAIWCASSNFLKVSDVLKFKNIESCIDELNRQYEEYWKYNDLLCDYKTCSKYGSCTGVCPAKNELIKFCKKL